MCSALNTWVGQDFGSATDPIDGGPIVVRCIRIFQNPNKYQRSVHLAKWDGEDFKVQQTFGVLTGDNWNRRPAG